MVGDYKQKILSPKHLGENTGVITHSRFPVSVIGSMVSSNRSTSIARPSLEVGRPAGSLRIFSNCSLAPLRGLNHRGRLLWFLSKWENLPGLKDKRSLEAADMQAALPALSPMSAFYGG